MTYWKVLRQISRKLNWKCSVLIRRSNRFKKKDDNRIGQKRITKNTWVIRYFNATGLVPEALVRRSSLSQIRRAKNNFYNGAPQGVMSSKPGYIGDSCPLAEPSRLMLRLSRV